jgi:hypothetical protein
MIRVIGKPSRIRDGIGVAVLAGTALLYAFQATHAETAEACASCDATPVTPVTAPDDGVPPGESLIAGGSGPEAA